MTSHDIFFGFILVDYQTELLEKYLVTGDWSQSNPFHVTANKRVAIILIAET